MQHRELAGGLRIGRARRSSARADGGGGRRASAWAAAVLKKARDEISEAVVADDIDKPPDSSVAEALQRLAGVQVARDRGEGTTVVVRGLGQVETTLDGREVFTALGLIGNGLLDLRPE